MNSAKNACGFFLETGEVFAWPSFAGKVRIASVFRDHDSEKYAIKDDISSHFRGECALQSVDFRFLGDRMERVDVACFKRRHGRRVVAMFRYGSGDVSVKSGWILVP